jgi:hypothetical protein
MSSPDTSSVTIPKMRVTAATQLRHNKTTIPIVNLQEFDFEPLLNRLYDAYCRAEADNPKRYTSDLGKFKETILENTDADAETQTPSKYMGYVGTFLGVLSEQEMAQLGLDEDSRDALYSKITKFVNEGVDASKQNKTRATQVLSEREEVALENAPDWKEIVNTIREIYYKVILPMYDVAKPEVHRYEMETYIALMLYVLEPNVRSAWRWVMHKGDCKDDNIIMFGGNGVVQYCMNKMKHKSQVPIPGVLCEETARMMKKHHDMFLKDNQFSDGYFFHKKDGTWWDKRDSFTRHLDDTLKKIFPQANLGVAILRILDITNNWEETASEEEKAAFAFVRGHAWNSNQTSLYNRQNSIIGQKRKAAELDADTDW